MKTNKPKILTARIEHCYDESPDTSYLGEYSNTPKEHAIDRQERGDMGRGEYRYFNPATVEPFNPYSEWIQSQLKITAEAGRKTDARTVWVEAMASNAEADYKRMEALQRGDWHYLGVIAKAEVQLAGDLTQTIRSCGLWGIESDSGKDYLASVAEEELGNLRDELKAIGFGSRAISYAFGKVETVQK